MNKIEEIIRPCGLGHSKARDISQCMKMLHGEFNDIVPDDFDKLMKLPGVGRKSANLIMGDVFHKPAIVTDTHCIRLTNRMGLIDNLKDPKKVEMESCNISKLNVLLLPGLPHIITGILLIIQKNVRNIFSFKFLFLAIPTGTSKLDNK